MLLKLFDRIAACLLMTFLLCCWATPTSAQQVEDEEPPEFLPGLVAEYRWPGQTARRIDPDILFDWSNSRPTSQMPTECDFGVTWNGQLWARDNGRFQLSLFVCGKVKVVLAGQQLLIAETTSPEWVQCAPIELRFGYHPLQIQFETTATAVPRLGVYWAGPAFSLEPISTPHLQHAAVETVDDRYAVGESLSRGLRCSQCHTLASDPAPLAAPALTHLQGNLQAGWLVERLMQGAEEEPTGVRKTSMPHFGLQHAEATAIASALFATSAASPQPEDIAAELRAANEHRNNKKKNPEVRAEADVAQGEITFVSTGCLACHRVGELGPAQDLDQQLFGGGDLSAIANKRTVEFFTRWLADPAEINAQHRMPRFQLSPHQRLDLAAYLQNQGPTPGEADGAQAREPSLDSNETRRGMQLIEKHRCGACHQLPAAVTGPLNKLPLAEDSNWNEGCLGAPKPREFIPGFELSTAQRKALQHYLTNVNPQSAAAWRGPRLIAENNCTACHSRDAKQGLKSQLNSIVAAVPAVASRLAAIAPPTLTAVGDKLHAAALKSSIARQAPPLRPWLDVRMPQFNFSAEELDAIVDSFIAHDRIPDREPTAFDAARETPPGDTASNLAAARLVTAEGFGCQSCHAIGNVEPPNVDLNARGTNLAMLGERIRPSWFERWVRNPARIVPRMEMPAIQTPVKGVLHDSIDAQLAALWNTLNSANFRPPRPAPVRVIRAHNLPDTSERAWLLTDVIETPAKQFLRPLVVGLPNRHNFLFDLEQGSLATWWLGDMASQHTRGKTWFWEFGATLLLDESEFLERIQLIDAHDRTWTPSPLGQTVVRFDSGEHSEHGLVWQGRLHLSTAATIDSAVNSTSSASDDAAPSRWLTIEQSLSADSKGANATSLVVTKLTGLQPGDKVQVISSATATDPAERAGDRWRIARQLRQTRIELSSQTKFEQVDSHRIEFVAASELATATGQNLQWTTSVNATLLTDHFPIVDVPQAVLKPTSIDVVPGYAGIQLPLPPTEMPIALAWDEAGHFYAGSLKGRVLQLLDRDQDGLEDTYVVISDEFPTPYGLIAHAGGIDALAKFALIRLTPPTVDGKPHNATVVADGWGYTADYHDWAVGLERDAAGNYYMALPCQQDDRSEAAAYLRGNALKLIPYSSPEEPRQYRLEPLAAGLRFPMGIALNEQRGLFTSDNQGNYNPFNELNHLRPGKRYGFINKLENKDGFSPPFESPAINLPHPWTRSVNGMCFLTTPQTMADEVPMFGPFEGHLIGCEMNGKSLVRMSLQKVGDTYQGAAYMFSRPAGEGEANFEGPIACEISPNGELVVGSLQDSGWSGGQNTGSIVRLRPSGDLPLGIAEMRGTSDGFEIEFTQPIDPRKAAEVGNFLLRSYQRISTPAYGGDDQDERSESIVSLHVSEDRRRVHLKLSELREGFVYELNLAPLGETDADLFPSQAHYSMRTTQGLPAPQ